MLASTIAAADPKPAPRKVNVLVCSANMGNQAPDMDSLSAWIPWDGNIREVVEDQQYPLPEGTNPQIERKLSAVAGEVLKRRKSGVANSSVPTTPPGTTPKVEDPKKQQQQQQQQQFDIVVIGMQEATFEVESSISPSKSGGLLTSQAIKAQRVVSDLTKAKDHLGKVKDRQQQQQQQRITTSSERNRLPNLSKSSLLGSSITGGSAAATSRGGTGRATPDGVSLSSLIGSAELDPSNDDAISVLTTSDRLTSSERRAQAPNDTRVLHSLFQTHLPSYEHAVSYQRGQMRLMIFYNHEEISLEVISIKAQNTGKGGLANKGGIVSEVLVDGTTRLSFFTAHLEAHEGTSKYETRCSSVAEIFRGTTSSVTRCRCDASLASHFTFAMGDLNFRTRLPNHEPGSKAHIMSTHAMAETQQWEELYKYDELCQAMEKNHCFSGFSTPVCSFPPTFKIERQKGYVYNEKRSPSYTDRILYTTGHRLEQKLKVLAYGPVDDFASSDHKPIRGAFEIELNPRLKWRPTLSKRDTKRTVLAGGMALKMPNFRLTPSSIIAKPKKADQREYLHLFISSIHVQINKESYKKFSDVTGNSCPSPFVCFVSTPAEALKRDTTKWQKVVNTVNPRVGKNLSNSDGTRAWPKTRRKASTFDASWENEEIHFKVRTHTNEGLPIDLSGAMIHLAVFDGKSSGRLLGTFSLNLAHLITQSRQQTDMKRTLVEQTQRQKSVPSLFGRANGVSFRSHFNSSRGTLFGGSMMHLFGSSGKMGSNSSEQNETRPEKTTPLRGGKRDKQTSREQTTPLRRAKPDEPSSSAEQPSMIDEEPEAYNPVDKPDDHRTAIDNKIDEEEGDDEGAGVSKKRNNNHNNNYKEETTGVLTSGPSSELLRRAASKWLGVRRSSIDSVNIRSMKLSRPLRKYAQQVGIIQCTIDAWWLSDEDAEGRKEIINNEGGDE